MSNLYNKYLEMYIEDIDNNNSMVVIGSMEFLPSRVDRKSTRLNSVTSLSRMPSSA